MTKMALSVLSDIPKCTKDPRGRDAFSNNVFRTLLSSRQVLVKIKSKTGERDIEIKSREREGKALRNDAQELEMRLGVS